MHADPVVEAYLADVGNDLDAARRLAHPTVNRLAAFHLQQAAEKLVKAVRLARGLPATAEHHINVLVAGLPADDPLRPLLAPLHELTPYATTFRYPTIRGRIRSPMSADEVDAYADRIARLVLDVRSALGEPTGPGDP
jgi:HEPN domain-containing protein